MKKAIAPKQLNTMLNDYIPEDAEQLVCPNCDEEITLERNQDLMTAYNDDMSKAYFICPVCCVQNEASKFREYDV